VPDDFIDRVFMIMQRCHWHTFQVLTKRPERMLKYLQRFISDGQGWITRGGKSAMQAACTFADDRFPLPNVWLGVSVENQEYANSRIPELLKTPAAKRFVSYEPALGPVDFRKWFPHDHSKWPHVNVCDICGVQTSGLHHPYGKSGLDWIIVGGESGPGARPFDIRWARYAVQQCKAAGVPCFVKQMGSQPQTRNDQVADVWFYVDGSDMDTVEGPDHPEYKYQGGKVTLKLRDRKGGDMSEWPEDLRVREFPGKAIF
jgi:protein gp37